MPLRFSKSARLTRSSEFQKVRQLGRPYFGKFLIMNVLAHSTDEEPARIGLVTSRRVGNAVTRNLVRRRLREIVRQDLPRVRRGLWLVLVAKRAAADASLEELAGEWRTLVRRSSTLVP